jgi:hypothetical protein
VNLSSKTESSESVDSDAVSDAVSDDDDDMAADMAAWTRRF